MIRKLAGEDASNLHTKKKQAAKIRWFVWLLCAFVFFTKGLVSVHCSLHTAISISRGHLKIAHFKASACFTSWVTSCTTPKLQRRQSDLLSPSLTDVIASQEGPVAQHSQKKTPSEDIRSPLLYKR